MPTDVNYYNINKDIYLRKVWKPYEALEIYDLYENKIV